MQDYISVVQDSRLVVQGSRIEFGVYCDWCCGHGFEANERDDVVDCHECRGSGFKFQYVVEADNGNL